MNSTWHRRKNILCVAFKKLCWHICEGKDFRDYLIFFIFAKNVCVNFKRFFEEFLNMKCFFIQLKICEVANQTNKIEWIDGKNILKLNEKKVRFCFTKLPVTVLYYTICMYAKSPRRIVWNASQFFPRCVFPHFFHCVEKYHCIGCRVYFVASFHFSVYLIQISCWKCIFYGGDSNGNSGEIVLATAPFAWLIENRAEFAQRNAKVRIWIWNSHPCSKLNWSKREMANMHLRQRSIVV